MAFDQPQDPSASYRRAIEIEARALAERAERNFNRVAPHIAAFRASLQPLPQKQALTEADHAEIRAEADRLVASGYRAHSLDGLADSVALANRARLNAEDRA